MPAYPKPLVTEVTPERTVVIPAETYTWDAEGVTRLANALGVELRILAAVAMGNFREAAISVQLPRGGACVNLSSWDEWLRDLEAHMTAGVVPS